MKIIVLNDLHPSQLGGAAGIALQNAQFLAEKNEVEFWCSGLIEEQLISQENLRFQGFDYGQRKKWAQQKSQFLKLYFEFFDFQLQVRCFLNAIRFKPDLVWIHQVGNAFPKSISIVFHLLRVPTVQTFHDYSLLVTGKLYPKHFGWGAFEVDRKILDLENGNLTRPKLQMNNFFTTTFSRLRFFLLKSIASLNSVNILVGPQQESIFKLFGLTRTLYLPNVPIACTCEVNNSKKLGKTIRILFAGRPVGKGLERLTGIVANTKNAHLDLAGEANLLDYLPNHFPTSKFTYLGNLEHSDLMVKLHEYDFVSVMSDCFDVYPSILIETLAHSSRVICTSTVGNHILISSKKFGYVIPYNLDSGKLGLEEIINQEKFMPFRITSLKKSLSIESYGDALLEIANDVSTRARRSGK